MAEKEGFEPSIRFWAYAPLAGECLRPLGHLSKLVNNLLRERYYIYNALCCQIKYMIIFATLYKIATDALIYKVLFNNIAY